MSLRSDEGYCDKWREDTRVITDTAVCNVVMKHHYDSLIGTIVALS